MYVNCIVIFAKMNIFSLAKDWDICKGFKFYLNKIHTYIINTFGFIRTNCSLHIIYSIYARKHATLILGDHNLIIFYYFPFLGFLFQSFSLLLCLFILYLFHVYDIYYLFFFKRLSFRWAFIISYFIPFS